MKLAPVVWHICLVRHMDSYMAVLTVRKGAKFQCGRGKSLKRPIPTLAD